MASSERHFFEIFFSFKLWNFKNLIFNFHIRGWLRGWEVSNIVAICFDCGVKRNWRSHSSNDNRWSATSTAGRWGLPREGYNTVTNSLLVHRMSSSDSFDFFDSLKLVVRSDEENWWTKQFDVGGSQNICRANQLFGCLETFSGLDSFRFFLFTVQFKLWICWMLTDHPVDCKPILERKQFIFAFDHLNRDRWII